MAELKGLGSGYVNLLVVSQYATRDGFGTANSYVSVKPGSDAFQNVKTVTDEVKRMLGRQNLTIINMINIDQVLTPLP
jgi:hypothetical protein